jgi:hypothetical protein
MTACCIAPCIIQRHPAGFALVLIAGKVVGADARAVFESFPELTDQGEAA